MNKNVLLLLFLFLTLVGYSQSKQINFIIVVDGELSQIYSDQIKILDEQNVETIIKVNYQPGELSMTNQDYDKILSLSNNQITIKVRHIETVNDKTKHFDFEITDFNKNWLTKGTYFILYIYNTEKKKYRKLYNPIIGKAFTYDYDWSEGSMRRAKKK
jgi:hypothetical protein